MILERFVSQKEIFNVKNPEHIKIYKRFLLTNTWGHQGCRFFLEFPYLTIPDMIKDKLVHHFLKVKKVEL